MLMQRLLPICALLGALLLAAGADEQLGVVDPGEVSTFWSGMPLAADEREWEEAFYESYNFTAEDYSGAIEVANWKADSMDLPLVVLGLNESEVMVAVASDPSFTAAPSKDEGALKVASGEALDCDGCWIPTYRLPRKCDCVKPQCENINFAEECYVCQRGWSVYRSFDECMENGDQVESSGLAAADYPQADTTDQDEILTQTNTLCTSSINDGESLVQWEWEPQLPTWTLENSSDTSSRKLLQENNTATVESNACPHLQSGLCRWEDKATWGGQLPQRGSDVVLPKNKKIVISSCSLIGMANPYFRKINIPESTELIFADTSMELTVSEILVDGALRMGSPSCRLQSKIKLSFRKYTGMQASGFGIDTGSKSEIDIHGREFSPTWTRLAATANKGATSIQVQASVSSWLTGHRIVLVSTIWKDLQQNQNEVLVVKRVLGGGRVIELETALQYSHYGGPEYQAEVGLLSRSIELLGTADTVSWGYANEGAISPMGPSFGPHFKFSGTVARISGVYTRNAGQTNQLGRYAMHFHMMGTRSQDTAFIKDSSIHESNFRCVAVHGTSGMLVQDNVGFWTNGNCFYLETGAEERNVFHHNLAAYVLPINTMGGWGQAGDTRVEGDKGIVEPADSAAAAFYGANTYNTWTDNAGSGGFFVYSFPVLPRCLREFQNNKQCTPISRPFIKFKGNTAHSSGYLWEHGACFYTGGSLEHRASDNKLVYRSGRVHNRDTRRRTDSHKVASLRMHDIKAFLCQVGINHWGNRMVVTGFEAHDVLLSASMLGDSTLRKAIINLRTPNRASSFDTKNYWDMMRSVGFGWYDTSTRTILSSVEFRNFRVETNKAEYHRSTIFSSLTYSDYFTPHVMSYSKGLKFTNCDHPGALLRLDKYDSNSYRQFQWIDADGSASGWGKRAIIGSEPSFTAVGDVCAWKDTNPSSSTSIFMCKTDTKLARIELVIPGVTDTHSGCCGFPADSSKYGLGLVYQMGYTGVSMRWSTFTRNGAMVGPTGKHGWYYSFNGKACPKTFQVHVTQVPADSPVYIAMRYPPFTTISVQRKWKYYSHFNQVCRPVGSKQELVSNDDTKNGCVFYFDNSFLYLKISDLDSPQELKPWQPWLSDGISISAIRYSVHWFEVSTSLNCGQAMCACGVQPAVPPAMW